VPSYPAEAPLVEVEESENILPEHLGRRECLYILCLFYSKIFLKKCRTRDFESYIWCNMRILLD
jgi:hypothetical protein